MGGMGQWRRWPGLVTLALSLVGCGADAGVGSDVRAAAERGLPRFLASIPPGRERDFGFNERSELARATVAAPFRMAVPDAEGVPVPLTTWRVPVMVDGSPRALLSVTLREGELRCTELGGAGLAAELGRVPMSARVLLRVPHLGADFACDDDDAWPLRSAQRLLHLEEQPMTLAELRPWLAREAPR